MRPDYKELLKYRNVTEQDGGTRFCHACTHIFNYNSTKTIGRCEVISSTNKSLPVFGCATCNAWNSKENENTWVVVAGSTREKFFLLIKDPATGEVKGKKIVDEPKTSVEGAFGELMWDAFQKEGWPDFLVYLDTGCYPTANINAYCYKYSIKYRYLKIDEPIKKQDDTDPLDVLSAMIDSYGGKTNYIDTTVVPLAELLNDPDAWFLLVENWAGYKNMIVCTSHKMLYSHRIGRGGIEPEVFIERVLTNYSWPRRLVNLNEKTFSLSDIENSVPESVDMQVIDMTDDPEAKSKTFKELYPDFYRKICGECN